MLTYPAIDPVLISIGPFELLDKSLGPLQVHWYGVMYLCAFVAAWGLAAWRSRRAYSPCKPEQIEDLIVYGALGVVLGGRCGYVLFYHFERFVSDPVWLFRVWEGGMSFHGGLLGVILAMAIYARKIQQPFFSVADFVVPLVPLGLGFGRMGNFIGQELWGRAADVSWAMVFPRDPLQIARHPSQLYQAALEGLVLFLVLFWFSFKPKPRMAVSGLFLTLYGTFRFGVEFFREPDSHIGFDLMGWMTRGQLLSAPMILLGIILLLMAYKASLFAGAASDGANKSSGGGE